MIFGIQSDLFWFIASFSAFTGCVGAVLGWIAGRFFAWLEDDRPRLTALEREEIKQEARDDAFREAGIEAMRRG